MEDWIVSFLPYLPLFTTIPLILIWLYTLSFKKVGVERHLLTDVNKILVHIGSIMYFSITSGFIMVGIIDLRYDILDVESITDIFYFYIIIIILCSLFVTFIYSLVRPDNKYYYFIINEIRSKQGIKSELKLYIIKKIEKDLILLSSNAVLNEESIQMIKDIDFLKGKNIYKEKKSINTFSKKIKKLISSFTAIFILINPLNHT